MILVVAPSLYGYAVEEFDRVLAGIVQHRECVPLVGQPGARGQVWAAASVLATEQAIEAVAQRLVGRETQVTVGPLATTLAIADKERTLGRSLTASQRHAIAHVLGSGRCLDLIVGVAGSGKTTAVDVLRAGYEGNGYRVLGTAISGQAAPTLHNEGGIDSRTIASLVWRLEHQQLTLDDRTVLLIDEAGMADDRRMLRLLSAVDVAGAKAVVVGDHHQLDAVEAGGGLEALIHRHGAAVHVLGENIRQRDPAERAALEQLRGGKITEAIDWYRDHDRLRVSPTRDDALDAAIDAWKPTCEPPRDRPARLASPRRRRPQRTRPPASGRSRRDLRPGDRRARRQALRGPRPAS